MIFLAPFAFLRPYSWIEKDGKGRIAQVSGNDNRAAAKCNVSGKLENDYEMIVHTAGKMRKNRIRVLAGDKALVEMTPYNLTKGRITYRCK